MKNKTTNGQCLIAAALALVGLASAPTVRANVVTYSFWRPYHAIRNADLDPNPATTADPDWGSLVQPVPNHPEYMLPLESEDEQ